MWLSAVRSPKWLGRIVFAVGLLTVASALIPPFRGRVDLISEMVPAVFPAAATTGAAAVGVLLIVLSRGLRRGKFRAWALAIVLDLVATVLHVIKALDVEEAVLCLIVLALLLAGRPNFTARPDPRSLVRLVTVIVVGPFAAAGLGFVWLAVDAHGQQPGTSLWDRATQSVLGLVGIAGPIQFVSDTSAARTSVALAVLGAIVVVVAVWVALQPSDGPHPLSASESQRLRTLIDGTKVVDSLSYFALRDDRSVIFSPSGRSALTYRVVGTVSLAAGDPIGEAGDWADSIEAWRDEARAFGWRPAVLGASERGAEAFHRAGFDVLELGDEAIVRTADFSLQGSPMKGVRQAIARCERAGVTVRVDRVADIGDFELRTVREHADHWRDGPVERGFSMALGRCATGCDGRAVLVRAYRGHDLVGLLQLVPWGADGLSLDVMRRDREGANGIIETMIAALMAAAPGLGVRQVSLNFAVFRSVFSRGERLGAGPSTRLWRAILLGASRFWQIESLYRANSKYQPEWVPRFICYEHAGDLPSLITAALRAEAFLVAPAWLRRLSRA